MSEEFYKPQKEEIAIQPKGVLRESNIRMIIDRKRSTERGSGCVSESLKE